MEMHVQDAPRLECEMPRRQFLRAISEFDAEDLALYLATRFPKDPNRNLFLELSKFVCGARHEVPLELVISERDRHFFELMLRLARRRRGYTARLEPKSVIEIGPDLDFLVSTCLPAKLTAIQIAAFATSVRQVPSRNVAVVLMARDEGIYLPEWFSHYRALGAEHIFVYTNDNADGSSELLRELARTGAITLIDSVISVGTNPQRKAYQHATLLLDDLRDFRWALFVDADEFLYCDSAANLLPRVIETVEARFVENLPGAILFPWRWRFTDRAFDRHETTMLGQYQNGVIHKLFKSLVNTREAIAMCEVHIPTVPEDGFFVDGELRRVTPSDVWNGVQRPYSGPVIEHFWSKSFIEFLVKKRRGDQLALAGGQFKRDLVQFFAWTGCADESNFAPISADWVKKISDGVTDILSDKGVAEAYEAVVRQYRQVSYENANDKSIRATYEELLKSTATKF